MVALEVANGTAVVAGPAAAALLDAFAHGNIAFSFSVSGFLISYFAGIYAVFNQMGIITNNTKIAGASSGGLLALAHCSGVADHLPEIVTELSFRCRRRANCQTTLDRGVRDMFAKMIPPDAYKRCTGLAYVSITSDDFPSRFPANNMLVSTFASNKEVINAAAATSYIPLWSGKSLTTKFEGKNAYDGFFSNPQPCPPDVAYCVRISSANPPWTTDSISSLLAVMGRAASLDTGRPTPLATSPPGGFSTSSHPPVDPTHPNITAWRIAAALNVDIAPGIFSDTRMSHDAWLDLVVLPGDAGINRHLYRLGRQDAKAWAEATGLAAAAAARNAAGSTVTGSAAALRVDPRSAAAVHDAAIAAGRSTATAAALAKGDVDELKPMPAAADKEPPADTSAGRPTTSESPGP